MRSMLTMLGVIIGVAAVIATLAIGAGRARLGAGADREPGLERDHGHPAATPTAGAVRVARAPARRSPSTTWTPSSASARRVASAAWSVRSSGQVAVRQSELDHLDQGTTADYFAIRDWTSSDGSAFTDSDVRNAAKVCVLGATVADNLFQGRRRRSVRRSASRTCRSRSRACSSARAGNAMGQDQDDLIIAPCTTVQRKFLGGTSSIGFVMVSARSADLINPAIDEISSLLRQRHHIRQGQDDDFIDRATRPSSRTRPRRRRRP